MKTVAKKLYEAMFLVDSAQAASDWDGVISGIENILKKAEREIVSIRKWDERKLAYEIKGHSRGTYILCYFRANGEKIQDIERDVQLSERILRVLILSAEHMGHEDIEKDTPVLQAEERGQKIAQEVVKEAEGLESQPAGTVGDVSESERPEQTEAENAPEPVAEQGQEEADTEMSS